MPWVRLDENAMDHPKFISLSANAFRLWVEGLSYCQKHLTDGLIPRAALRGLRYYSVASAKLLTTVLVPGKGPLWIESPAGIEVHDYLEHNESRDIVLGKRNAAKERMQTRRSREQGSEHARERTAKFACGVSVLETDLQIEPEGECRGETLPQRAGSFCEWYADTHSRLIGVGYIGNPQKDYQTAIQLCAKLTDQELRDAAIVWFGMDDDFATKGTRTISKFASRATHCVQLARKVSA